MVGPPCDWVGVACSPEPQAVSKQATRMRADRLEIRRIGGFLLHVLITPGPPQELRHITRGQQSTALPRNACDIRLRPARRSLRARQARTTLRIDPLRLSPSGSRFVSNSPWHGRT